MRGLRWALHPTEGRAVEMCSTSGEDRYIDHIPVVQCAAKTLFSSLQKHPHVSLCRIVIYEIPLSIYIDLVEMDNFDGQLFVWFEI